MVTLVLKTPAASRGKIRKMFYILRQRNVKLLIVILNFVYLIKNCVELTLHHGRSQEGP